MNGAALAIVAFAAMEPITAWTHRFVMHGVGWALHRSHHSPLGRRIEANDAFPVMFAALVCLGLAIGFNVGGAGALVPIGIGVTAYGAAYALVHDGAIHDRLPGVRVVLRRTPARRLLDQLAGAHAVHHRTGGAPFGMLLPVVPRRSRTVEQPGQRVAPGPTA